VTLLKLDVFGRRIEVLRQNNQWCVYYLGNDGKKRKAHDIVLPTNLDEADVVATIADLCHEWATPAHCEVKVL